MYYHLTCAQVPRLVEHFDYSRITAAAKSSLSNSTDREKAYKERQKKMTPDDEWKEEQALKAYADGNKDLSAWEDAGVDLGTESKPGMVPLDRKPFRDPEKLARWEPASRADDLPQTRDFYGRTDCFGG